MNLLLTGSESGDQRAVDQFLASVSDQRIRLDNLWIAERPDGRLAASLLLVPAAGRTAMIFLCPIAAPQCDDSALLIGECLRAQDSNQMRLVQTLLDPWQEHEETAFDRAGFLRLANLLYLEKRLTPWRHGVEGLGDLAKEFDVVTWSEGHRPLFERAILESYVQTLDCPRLIGLRTIDDILESHRSSGQFTPGQWFVLGKSGEPVGVMLINLAPGRSASELVYLGLSPAWRGKGLGRRLMRRAIELSEQQGCTTMLTAVDEGNPPAVRLYASLGFGTQTRKLAMLRALP